MSTLEQSSLRLTPSNQNGEPASGGTGTPAVSVVAETAAGQASAVGVSTNYARQDHTHGTPALPTPAAIGAAATVHTHAEADVTGLVTDLAAKLANSMPTARLLGRTTAGTGAVENVAVGTGLSLTGLNLTATFDPLNMPVASDVGTADTGAVQPVLAVNVAGGGAEVKLGSANGDLVILHGADRIASFGPGNGGSMYGTPIFPKQVRLFGHVYHEVDLTTFTPSLPHTPQEAVRIIAKAHKSDGSQSAAVNITNNPDGSDIVQPSVYHAIQINVSADAPSVAAELGGVVCFLKQVGATTTSIVPFDASAQVTNAATGYTANMIGINIGIKNDFLGAVNHTNGAGAFIRQAGVGSSVHHSTSVGSMKAIWVDRPEWWDYTTGTITASAGSTIVGSGTTWTTLPKTGESGNCSLLGKWITWTATSGTVVSKRIFSVTNNTTLVLATAIIAGETALAGTAYRIVMSDPWDYVVDASGLAASPAISLVPEARLAPSQFTGVLAVQTSDPTTPSRKYGWSWDGVMQARGVKTTQASYEPPFIIPRVSEPTNSTTLTTTTPTDIGTATVTFTPAINCRISVAFGFDVGYTSGAGPFIGTLVVNGTTQGPQCIYYIPVAGARSSCSQTVTMDLTGGTSYTIKLQGQLASAGSYIVYPLHTGFTITAVGRI